MGNYFFFSCDWRKKGQFCEIQDTRSLCAVPAVHTDKVNVGAKPVAVSHLDHGPPSKIQLRWFHFSFLHTTFKKRQRQRGLYFFWEITAKQEQQKELILYTGWLPTAIMLLKYNPYLQSLLGGSAVCTGADSALDEVAGNKHRFGTDHIGLCEFQTFSPNSVFTTHRVKKSELK